METVTLAKIIGTLTPGWRPILTSKELDSKIVLQYGLSALSPEDVLEIVEASIWHTNGVNVTVH